MKGGDPFEELQSLKRAIEKLYFYYANKNLMGYITKFVLCTLIWIVVIKKKNVLMQIFWLLFFNPIKI